MRASRQRFAAWFFVGGACGLVVIAIVTCLATARALDYPAAASIIAVIAAGVRKSWVLGERFSLSEKVHARLISLGGFSLANRSLRREATPHSDTEPAPPHPPRS